MGGDYKILLYRRYVVPDWLACDHLPDASAGEVLVVPVIHRLHARILGVYEEPL